MKIFVKIVKQTKFLKTSWDKISPFLFHPKVNKRASITLSVTWKQKRNNGSFNYWIVDNSWNRPNFDWPSPWLITVQMNSMASLDQHTRFYTLHPATELFIWLILWPVLSYFNVKSFVFICKRITILFQTSLVVICSICSDRSLMWSSLVCVSHVP